jgi:hypothetical protein
MNRPLLLGLGALVGIAGLIGFLLWLPVPQQADDRVPSTTISPQLSPIVTPLNIGSLIQLTSKDLPLPTFELLSEPIAPTNNASRSQSNSNSAPTIITTIPKDAVLEVLSKSGTAQQGQWVQFRVCSVFGSEAVVITGQKGWIRESEISAWVSPIEANPKQRGVCKK